MSRANPLQAAFNAGEIGPRLAARVDFAKYRNAGARVENLIPLPQGGLTRRPGTRFIAAAAEHTKRSRLLPFEFSTEQAYVIEACDGCFRFFQNKAQVSVADTDAAISNGDFATDLTDWDDRSTGTAFILFGSEQRVIDRTLGTIIGNMTAQGGLAAAFDGNTNQSNTQSAARGDVTSATIGKNWGAGQTRTITGVKIHGSNSLGFSSANVSVTLTLQGSSDNFSSDVNNLGVIATFTDTNNESAGYEKLSGLVEDPYQYHRVLIDPAGQHSIYCAELIFYETNTNPLDGMQLVGNGTDIAWGEQDVTTTATGVEHVLQFRVNGNPGDVVKLSIGTTSTGGEIINDLALSVGYHSIAFTPPVSTFFVQFKNTEDQTVAVDDVVILVNQPLELVTPYREADLKSLKFAQSADVMYFAHPDYRPYKLERRGNTTWSLVEVFFADGPYLDENTTSGKTIQPSSTSGTGIVLTAVGHEPFAPTDEGRLIRLHPSGEPGYAVITQFESTTSVRADVKRAFAATTATENWSFGAWSNGRGWPSVVTFYEQRLAWANSRSQPQSFWLSQSADLENMRPDSFEGSAVEVQDDDSLDFTIAADQVNAIRWMSPGRQLILGTSGGEWSVTSDGPVLTPLDMEVKRESTNGSADILPVRIGSIVLFVQRAKRKLREFVFSLETDGFRTPDLTILADHISQSGIRDVVYQQEPDSQVHCLREDGVLATLTYRREQDVVGWSRHILGGQYEGGNAVIEGLVTIPGSAAAGSENQDEAWVTAKRTINGSTFRSIEVFEAPFEGPNPAVFDARSAFDAAVLEAQRQAFYVDAGLTYEGPETQTLSGLDHLEGETVTVLANGARHPDRIVVGGAISLEVPVSIAHVGLAYQHNFTSLKIEAGAQAGTAVGKVKRIHGISLVLLHSLGLRIGPSPARLEEVPLREVEDAMDTAVPLFSGERRISFDGDYDRDARIVVTGDAPLPFTILAVAPELKTNEQL